MKLYAVRRYDNPLRRHWSRSGSILTQLVDTVVPTEDASQSDPPSDDSKRISTIDLEIFSALAAQPKHAYSVWALDADGTDPVNVYAATYIDKRPLARFLGGALWRSVLLVASPTESALGITIAESDDVSALGVDSVLSAAQWRDLSRDFFPQISLAQVTTANGIDLTATASRGDQPFDLTGTELYWECTGGWLRSSRTPVEGNSATNTVLSPVKGSKVKVGFRFFTGVAECVL
ncbi:MAG: hypothetical protein RLZZ153_539 [Pseudomonadota bacterium]|jgi:hypothetical protein